MATLPVRRGGRNTSLVNPTREFEDIYDRMGQLVMWAVCPTGEHGLRGGKWDRGRGPWRGERS